MTFEKIQKDLVCPNTGSDLLIIKNSQNLNSYFKSSKNNNLKYPIINNTPIIINENNSLFKIENISKSIKETKKSNKIRNIIKYFTPSIGINLKSKEIFKKILKILPKKSKILIIGGAVRGSNIDLIFNSKKYKIISTDIYNTKYVDIINDCHDLCFKDETFDCVIIQAVLEHVLDPKKCVKEIHRVLKKDAIIYAETPFIQQVHSKQYDFTRFTYLGYLWLFKNFNEESSGPCCGTGMALAWSILYFLRSLSNNKLLIYFFTMLAYFLTFLFKYLDFLIINNKGSYDGASGYYFFGKKSKTAIKKSELLKKFVGN